MTKKITIKTGSLDKAAKEFVDAWRHAEKEGAPDAPIEKISFTDQALLFKTLTPKRFELLEYVHAQDGISIRALSKALERDYSNVHQDVKLLYQLGLMMKDSKSGQYYVPWDVIVTEITLPTLKKTKHPRYKSKQHPPSAANG